MPRYKTFDSTGIAPNGVLFAGDENAMQDRAAELANFAQTVDLGTLRVGNSALQLLQFAADEFRMTGLLRTDGIMRALGGLFAGTFTTTQRNAIPAGKRPYGLIILNTTTNQFEWNIGTDAAPKWVPVGASELAYNSFVSAITVTPAHTEASPIDIVVLPTTNFDGVAPITVEFFAPEANGPTGDATRYLALSIWRDGVNQGMLGQVKGTTQMPLHLSRRVLPPSGDHTYAIRGWINNGGAANGSVVGGAGGAGTYFPGYGQIVRS